MSVPIGPALDFPKPSADDAAMAQRKDLRQGVGM